MHHSQPHGFVTRWLPAYLGDRLDVELYPIGTLILDADNEVRPDVCMCSADGRSPRPGNDGYLHGAPDLIVEIAATSASYDLHSRLNAYRRNGVQEYHRLDPDANGVIHGRVFPGSCLSPAKIFAGDLKAVHRVQRRRAPRS